MPPIVGHNVDAPGPSLHQWLNKFWMQSAPAAHQHWLLLSQTHSWVPLPCEQWLFWSEVCQNSLSSSPQATSPRPFHFLLPWKWTLHPDRAICALLLPLVHLVTEAHLVHWACNPEPVQKKINKLRISWYI